MTVARVLAMLAPVALAACDGGATPRNDAAAVSPNGAAAAPPGAVAPPAGQAPAPAPAPKIPAAYQGAWVAAGGACVEGNPLRIEVGPDGILFHESYAGVRSSSAEGDDRLAVSMVVSGEGETWDEDAVLALSSGGNRLTRTLADGRTLGYTRCPSS